MKVDVFGGGAFGTALALSWAKAGHEVRIWARDPGPFHALGHAPKLPDHPLPDAITVTGDATTCTADIAVLAIPTQAIDQFLADHPLSARMIVNCAKGLHLAKGCFPSDLIRARYPDATIAQMTGPSFAADIARGLPTALTLACADTAAGTVLQTALSAPNLRLYRSEDLRGAEIGGALKNPIAIACGACIGEGMGDSARAALMTRGFAEMTRFATALGARPETLAGLSGMGDLALTCGSDLSRNYRFGRALGHQEAYTEPGTVEGVATAQAVAKMATERGIDMPIITEVASMIHGGYSAAEAIRGLLARPLKPE